MLHPMDPRVVMAARNNADWCDLVCRTHGVDTRFDPDVWVALRRSPPLYPDAITLREQPRASDVLRRVDPARGCSIKDSFASIDLSPDGFRPLFEAEWVHRRAAQHDAKHGLNWIAVGTADELRAFGAAHGGGEVFRAALLDDPAVAILAAYDGDTVVAGVIGNRSDTVVGLSNLFTTTADPDQIWAGAVSALSARFPGLPLVGYEHGPSLQAAHRAGFVSVGPLSVWLKD
jgi:hypothetical protein